MALRPIDWELWKGEARSHLSTQSCSARASRAERLASFGVRAAFAVVTAKEFGPVRRLGALPCDRCGLWTHSWCEACTRPPAAICTECDAAEEVCHACEREGKSWRRARAAYEAEAPAEEETVEVSSVHAETGTFRPLDPPFRVPLRQILSAEGEIDTAELTRRATAHGRGGDGSHGAGSGGPRP